MSDGEKNVPTPVSQEPLLFISHKHSDTKIAHEIVKFVHSVSGGRVDVYVSSDPKYEGPRVGKALNQELKNALWRTGVVILVYTTQDKDWSWCMWECGLAEDPQSPDTKVVVLQCLPNEPEVFKGAVRVLAWEKESIEAFAKRFKDPDFFPNLGKAVTALNERELSDEAAELYQALAQAIPRQPPENWSAWPCMRLRLDHEVIDELKKVAREERVAKTREALLTKGIIILSASGSPGLFGRTELPSGLLFGQLVKDWSDDYPDSSTGWLDVIARQLIDGARRRRPNITHWERFQHVGSDEESVPGIGRIKSDAEAMSFDLYFVGMGQVPPVTSRMIRLENMGYLDLTEKTAQEVNLRELLADLEELRRNRIPILEGQCPKYIIHVSMIDRFLRKQAYAGQDIGELTLKDLLGDKAMEQLFATSWEVLPAEATIGDAQKAMRARQPCRDLFVTASGGRDEPVLGWLTECDLVDVIS